ncbi:ABC transporter substrate-binding protein [Nonomuraea sp. LPB2021202275-12-8]|uniref:ABC transporter substrate-binding protein n=1 Tax=Nonomuraea sp. LPB2021202275-12-8 TaxID=3120159 RepID=UPI00300D57D0
MGDRDDRGLLRGLFDRLMRRPAPWRGDRPMPQLSIFLTGKGDADLEEIIAPDTSDMPLFSLDAREVTDVRTVVDGAAVKLGQRTGPRGLPPIRFQLTAFVLLVMERKSAGKAEIPDMERALAANRPGRRGKSEEHPRGKDEDRPVVVWLDYLSRLLTGWVPAASLVAALAGQVITIVGWALSVAGAVVVAAGHAVLLARTHVRSSWFRRQLFHPRDSLERLSGYAHRLAKLPTEELELLLVNAFLEDLRQAYRRRRLFLWPAWARAYYCTLYLRDVSGAERPPFLSRLHTVRRRVARWDPLLVVTSGPERADLLPSVRMVRLSADTQPGEEPYRDWLHQARHRHGPSYLVVDGVDADVTQAPALPPPRLGHKRVRAYWTVMAALLIVPLLASGAYIWTTDRTYCQTPDVLLDQGECIGISDGGHVFHQRLARPIGIIEAENAKAVASGRHVEIAYIGPLTGSPQALLAGSHGELFGVAAYQQAYNASTSSRPKLRILLANPGRAFRRAVAVARQVVERLEGGAPIVGVIGMAQSRVGNQEAIAVLNAAGLPVVVTVGTADDLAVHRRVPAPYFFRMAADNERQAKASAAWIRAGSGDLPQARTVALMEDVSEGDLYSTGLAADFAAAFGDVTRLQYTGGEQLRTQVKRACDHELIYYTGRGDDFATFVEGLNEGCSQARTHHVLASDDVTKYVQDNQQQLGEHPNMRLHYVTLAWDRAWESPWAGEGRGGTAQLAKILALIGSDRQPSTLHAMLAHDAALALGLAVGSAYGGTDALPDKGTVLYGLGTLGTQYGTTGVIEFTRGREPHESTDKPVMLVQVPKRAVGEPGEQVLVGLCGRLTELTPPRSACPDAGLREGEETPA